MLSFLFAFSSFAAAGTKFQANTTLAAETGNNTSAADSFVSQSNGNIGATNISKMPTRSLLYPGSTAKIYAHLVPWFGFGDHMKVGYTSNDILQVQNQVNDMISRGLDGTIIDWYGRGEFNRNFVFYDQATQMVMQQAELHPGFQFALMYDAGALKTCAATAGCDVTQTMIDDLNYANTTFESSPAYITSNGRPVVYLFGDSAYPIDWTSVRASVAGNPEFIFRNSGGFTHTQSSGGFSWVAPHPAGSTSTDIASLGYLGNYYSTALKHPTLYSTGSGYKGFNDSLALWGSDRFIQQQCGQTWLESLAEAGKYYSATKQQSGIQLVTWNDYEEGSEIETGIDNCVVVTATVSATVVNWSITGQQNTIDHFSVFVSQDGQNLMWLADASAAARSMDLAKFALNAGNYIVFVKATGKPSLTNKMSAGVQLTVANKPPVASLSVTPLSGTAPVTVTASAASSSDSDGSIVNTSINFGDGSVAVNAVSASHTYKAAGTYTVRVTVADNLGATSSASAVVTVTSGNQPPVAALTVSPGSGYGPLTVTASTAGSSDPDGSIARTSINFGDGSATISGSSAAHTYSAAGIYTVTAVVTDNLGASSSTTATVTVQAPTVIVSSPVNGATLSSPVHVVASGFSGHTVTAMQIYLDFNLIYQIKSPNVDTLVNMATGTHSLIVKGWDSSGHNFMTPLSITVASQPPTAVLTTSAASILAGGSITASTSGSSDAGGNIASSSINFGDGSAPVAATSASHQYKAAGTYIITATVTADNGASSTTSESIAVKRQFVTVSSPLAGSTITTSTVHVVGNAFSGYAVTLTQIYVDGVWKANAKASTIDTLLPISVGKHRVTVQGWDSSGAIFKTSVIVTRE
ncbi:MAG TPA: PKD domain-containing protein [Candidatus Angelobacter sp.]|nr:PKD domain-containing protein [Candidatus Angelobacter sp.]